MLPPQNHLLPSPPQVGTARFIRALMTRATTEDARPHTPALVRALVAGVRAERSAAVRKAYAGAAAQVCVGWGGEVQVGSDGEVGSDGSGFIPIGCKSHLCECVMCGAGVPACEREASGQDRGGGLRHVLRPGSGRGLQVSLCLAFTGYYDRAVPRGGYGHSGQALVTLVTLATLYFPSDHQGHWRLAAAQLKLLRALPSPSSVFPLTPPPVTPATLPLNTLRLTAGTLAAYCCMSCCAHCLTPLLRTPLRCCRWHSGKEHAILPDVRTPVTLVTPVTLTTRITLIYHASLTYVIRITPVSLLSL